jgi:hypothetical protein
MILVILLFTKYAFFQAKLGAPEMGLTYYMGQTERKNLGK